MKNNFFFLTLALFAFGCSPKTAPTPTVLKTEINADSEYVRTARITSKKMNVIFRGVVNPFEIEVPGIPNDSIKVTVSQGKIKNRWKSSDYEIIPEKKGNLDILVTWRENQNEQSESFFYRVKNCPDPIPYLSGKFSTFETPDSISVDDFKSFSGLGTILKGFDFNAVCKIFGAEIVRIQKDGTRNIFQQKDDRFFKQGKEFLQTAERGDIFIFRKIICRCPGDEKDVYRNLLNFSV